MFRATIIPRTGPVLFSFLICCILPFPSDCQPTLTPLTGSKDYVNDGSSFYSFTWSYNTDGRTIQEVQLKYGGTGNIDITVAGRTPKTQLQVNPASGYSASRVSFSGSLSGNVGNITFRISNIVQSDSRIFKCDLRFTKFNPPGVQSSVELVVVVAPRITLKSPPTVTVDEGNMITLLCVATGNPKPTITWTKGSSVKLQTSITNYTISSAAKEDAGTYTCTAHVSVPRLSVAPDNYQVTVTVRYKPQITFLTANQTVNDGTDVTFFCRADAVPTPTAYNWFKNGVPIPSGSSGGFVNSGQALRVRNVKKDGAGRYSCSSTNIVGTGEENSTFLAVNYAPQTVTVTPNPAVVKLSQSITLDCAADGYPVPAFSWQFNGAVVGGATQKTYALNNAKVVDAGNYSCLARNFRGSKKATRVVNVEYAPSATTFTTGTPNNAVVQGTSATLTCSANGYPAPVYTLKIGNSILFENSVTGTYDISNVQLNTHDGQVYSCEPSNAEGKGPTQSLILTVHVRPRFNPPQTLPTTKQIRNDNQIMEYTCAAEAKPYASIRWMLNGQNLTNIAPYNITERISGPEPSKLFRTFGYLNIKHLTWQQYGNFSCVAINYAGSVKQNTELEVRYRPVVQSPADHPKNLTLAEGQTATFNCKTIGNPPTTAHKWQFHGSDLQGEGCTNCPTTTLRIGSVRRQDEGWYGCVGTNSLGDGPPAKAQLLIKRKPRIDYFPKSVYTVNETNNITMVCGADGVPRPTITWKMSNGRIVGEGEEFHIVAASETDDGAYICFAQNELGDDSKRLTLQVQTRPTIRTSTPTTTNIPGDTGERVDLTCIVKGKPSPTLSWRRDLNGKDLSATDEKVESITNKGKATTMKIVVTTAGKEVGDKFYCVATNILGSDTQQYIIRERGPPDPPQDVKVVPFTVPDSETVSVNVSWTPGYSGGYDQQFSIHYRKKGSGSDFTDEFIGLSPNNMHTVQQLSPNTTYEFMMQASNQRGNSPTSLLAQVTTSDAAVAPPRGTVTATRADDPTEIVVTWTVTDNLVNKLKLEILEDGEGSWSAVSGASDMTTSTTQFRVKNLKADAKYKFRLDMRRPGENNPTYVESNEAQAAAVVPPRGTDPSTATASTTGTANKAVGQIDNSTSFILFSFVVFINSMMYW